MTTPQTPAGWYSDPDGSGGQRYWDGYTWTEHRAPAPQAPPPPPPAARVGSHRAPEPEPEPVAYTATPVGSVADSGPAAEPAADPAPADATAIIPTSPPPMAGPPSGAGGAERQLLSRYLMACAALLAVLVAVVVYAAFFSEDRSVTIGASDDPTTSAAATPTTDGNGWGETPTESSTDPTPSETEEPTPTESGDPQDGTMAFSVLGIEVGPTVVSAEAPIEKTAVGEFVVVHMTVTNVSDAPATFLGVFQKLKAGGAVYSVDDEATFYTGGGLVGLNPGDQAEVAVAFDVPPGTTPEAIELHGDPMSPGVEIPLP